MADEGEGDEFAVPEFIDDDATEDDAEAESGESGSADFAELGCAESEFFGPEGEDASAECEADAGGEDGHETGPEEAVRVWRLGALTWVIHSAHSVFEGC